MRFPLALTAKIAAHIVKHKIKRTPKFALVLEDCLASARECDAPMVSICGGEPLIYPKIEELTAGLLEQGRIVYVCTNGMFMRKKMKDYLAAIYSPAVEPKLKKLLDQ